MKSLFLLEEFIKEALIDEAKKKRKSKKRKSKKRKSKKRKKSTKYPSQYKATGKRKETLDVATKLAKSDDPAEQARGRKMRDDQEAKVREKMKKKKKKS